MKELYKKIEEKKITIIGIHTPASIPEDIQKALKQYGLDYPICIDTNAPAGGKGFGSMSSAYGVSGIPYAFVINRKGRLVGHGWGVADVLDTAVRLANKPSN
jgi:peroxiredoxin